MLSVRKEETVDVTSPLSPLVCMQLVLVVLPWGSRQLVLVVLLWGSRQVSRNVVEFTHIHGALCMVCYDIDHRALDFMALIQVRPACPHRLSS